MGELLAVLFEFVHVEQQRGDRPIELADDRRRVRGRLRARGCVLRLKRRRLERRGSSHPCRMARVGSIVMLRHKYRFTKGELVAALTRDSVKLRVTQL